MSQATQMITTGIWHEMPEANNRYATRVARCHGYDVFGQMLGNARWSERSEVMELLRANIPPYMKVQTLEA